ncbi:MAG: PcfJ domain-containing protein, partial [Oscillospiraceae bacterium]
YKFEFSNKVSAVECYLFTPNGNFGQIKAYKDSGQNICQFEKWQYKDEIKDRFGSYFPVKIFDINNTVLKNCKIEEFKDRFARTANVIKYLDTYTKYPCVENLLMNGFFELVNEKCNGSKILNETCDFKKFKIKDILGLNKEEIDRCRIVRWSGEKIADYKVCKKEFAKTPTEIQLIAYREIKRADYIKTKDKKGLFKFMEYQLKKQEIASCNILSIWQDYVNISKKNGDDLSKEYLLYPKKLKERHNEAVKRAKFKEKEEFKIMFNELADAYKPLSFVKGDYCIRIAKNENELIQEGKILEHCVGGYGGNHCAGRCIFFVRLAATSDQPLYTLQIDIKKGEQLQLHGANNEMHGQKIPQEVQTFIDYWLKNVFLKYDMTEKKLINKRHTNKVA